MSTYGSASMRSSIAPTGTSKPARAQQAAEDEQVVRNATSRGVERQPRHGAREQLREPAPADCLLSSRDFSTTPSVSSTAAMSSSCLSSAASAATQSSVSETPGTL